MRGTVGNAIARSRINQQDSDIPDYYAFFVFDPDGLRIEVFSPGPDWSSRIHS